MLLAVEVAQRPDVLTTAAQVCFYAGIALLVGSSVVGLSSFERAPVRLIRGALGAWVVAATAAITLGEIRRSALAIDLMTFIGTPLGSAALLRAIGLVVANVGILVALLTRGRARKAGLAAIGIGAAAAAVGHGLSSHAGVGSFTTLKIAEQGAHIIAVGAWIGGLAALLISIKGEPDEVRARAVRRFSVVAGVSLFVVAGTGLMRALQEVGSIDALVETTYGKMVLFKTELLLGLAILGTVNRYRNVPAAQRDLRGLRRIGTAEIAIALVAMAVTGVLSGTVPAREALARQIAARVPEVERVQGGITLVTYHDGSTMQAYADPGRAGPNEIHLTYFDPRGKETPVEGVALTALRGPQIIQARLQVFSPGHLVAFVDLDRGTWTMQVEDRRRGARERVEFEIQIA